MGRLPRWKFIMEHLSGDTEEEKVDNLMRGCNSLTDIQRKIFDISGENVHICTISVNINRLGKSLGKKRRNRENIPLSDLLTMSPLNYVHMVDSKIKTTENYAEQLSAFLKSNPELKDKIEAYNREQLKKCFLTVSGNDHIPINFTEETRKHLRTYDTYDEYGVVSDIIDMYLLELTGLPRGILEHCFVWYRAHDGHDAALLVERRLHDSSYFKVDSFVI